MGNSVYCEMVLWARVRLGLGLDSCSTLELPSGEDRVAPHAFLQVKLTAEPWPQQTHLEGLMITGVAR